MKEFIGNGQTVHIFLQRPSDKFLLNGGADPVSILKEDRG